MTVVTPFAANAQLNLFKPKPTDQSVETNTFADKAGFDTTKDRGSALTLVGTLINTFLGLLGIVFLLLVVYGGFLWMTAQGAEEEVTKAKKLITQAVIGLVIVMAAYAISKFVVGNIQEKTLKLIYNLSIHSV